MNKNNNDEVYKILPSLFNLSEKISKLKKKLNNEEERKTISENFIRDCIKLITLKSSNEEDNFMAASFIFSNKEIIEWSLKYCSNNAKDSYQSYKNNFDKFLN